MRLYATKRDVEILKFVNDMKFSNVEMIHERFISERGVQYLQRRMKRFSDLGFVLRLPDWGGRKFLYTVTDEGVSLVLRHGFNTVPHGLDKIDVRNFEHDKILIDLRVKLESKGLLKDWVSERVLRYEDDLLRFGLGERIIPDAYARSVNRGDLVVIEFEHARKSNPRIKALLKSYESYFREKSDYGRLLLFFSNDSVMRYYKREYLRLQCSFGCEFIHVQEVGVDIDRVIGGRYVTR